MDLDNIRLLEHVIRLGSMQRAATHLGMPRSTLRRRLDALAEEVGCAVLVASETGVTLTPAGTVVLEQGRALLEAYARMLSTAREPESTASGTISVIVPVGAPETVRVGLLTALHSIAPDLCIEEKEYADPLEHLDEPFDLMVYAGDPPSSGVWFSRTLRRAQLVPLASEAYLSAHGRPRDPSELASHRTLGWRLGKLDPREWPLRNGEAISVVPICCSSNGQFLHRAAQQGCGILLGDPDPTLLVDPTRLVPVLDDQIGVEIVFRLLSPTPTGRDPRSRAVLASIQHVISTLPATD